jgi:hypothetical protein
MSSLIINYDTAELVTTIMTWGQVHELDIETTLKQHLEQKFPVRSVSVLVATTENDILMLKLRSEQWKEDKEFGLTADGSLVW